MQLYKNFNRADKVSRSSINPNITYSNPLPIEVELNPSQYINKDILNLLIYNYILKYIYIYRNGSRI